MFRLTKKRLVEEFHLVYHPSSSLPHFGFLQEISWIQLGFPQDEETYALLGPKGWLSKNHPKQTHVYNVF